MNPPTTPSRTYSPAPVPGLHFANPFVAAAGLFEKRELIWQFTVREVAGRYKGLSLGMLWSLLNPLFMLAIYTYVFGIVLKSSWAEPPGSDASPSVARYAVILFCGLAVFNIAAECMTRAPTLITSNPNYVKKVVFPLEVLPVSIFGAAFVHGLISFVLLEIASASLVQNPSWTVFLLPLVLLPLVFLCIGAGWLFAALGVFLRDINYIMNFAIQALLFMSPIFYPASRRTGLIMSLNPLAPIVEGTRDVLLWGRQPDWVWLLKSLIFSVVFMQLGYVFFMKSKRAFADVI